MVTYLLLQVLIWIYATGRGAHGRRLWLIPAVMALWANCHSLFSVGLVMIACQIGGTLLSDLPFLPSGWRIRVDPATRTDPAVRFCRHRGRPRSTVRYHRGDFAEARSRSKPRAPSFRMTAVQKPFSG